MINFLEAFWGKSSIVFISSWMTLVGTRDFAHTTRLGVTKIAIRPGPILMGQVLSFVALHGNNPIHQDKLKHHKLAICRSFLLWPVWVTAAPALLKIPTHAGELLVKFTSWSQGLFRNTDADFVAVCLSVLRHFPVAFFVSLVDSWCTTCHAQCMCVCLFFSSPFSW